LYGGRKENLEAEFPEKTPRRNGRQPTNNTYSFFPSSQIQEAPCLTSAGGEESDGGGASRGAGRESQGKKKSKSH
jgi:hypothetical protein